MKRNIFITGLFAAMLLFTSCELDINEDPSYPKDATVEMLLPSAITWSSVRLGYDLSVVGSCWSQYYTQENSSNQYNSLVTYNETASDYNGVWRDIYAGGLADLKQIIKKSENEKKWEYYVIAKTLTAFNYHILVDFYGTIPFSESNQGVGNVAPKFEDGKAVNAGIVKILDEAIAKEADAIASADKAAPKMGGKDYVFQGDMSKWIGFAKALKVKILMRDYNANKVAIADLLKDPKMLSYDAGIFGYQDKEYNSNPFYESERRKLNTQNNLRGTATVINYLKANNDPRLKDYYEAAINPKDPSDNNYYAGFPYGNTGITTTDMPVGVTSRAKLGATDPVYFISLAEFLFIKAEFYARENDPAKAKTAYDEAVKEAFKRWGHDATSFIAAGGVYEFKPAEMMKCIMTQKWLAAVRAQAWDAFLDINRTGIPAMGSVQADDPSYVLGELVPAASSVLLPGEFPRRLLLPKASTDFNPNTPKVIPLATKMWWHK